MNSVVRQLHEQGTDIVMVDTGNSYEGLCEYLGGKYISYTKERPITMNPFRITRKELNVEKMEFLKNMVLLIWKGAQGEVNEKEEKLVNMVIAEYYDVHFNGFHGYTEEQRQDILRNIKADVHNKLDEGEEERNRRQRIREIIQWKKMLEDFSSEDLAAAKAGSPSTAMQHILQLESGLSLKDMGLSADEIYKNEKERRILDSITTRIDEIELQRLEMKVTSLSFNSFYEYAMQRLPDICWENTIQFDFSSFRFMMKEFYKGGLYEKTLNEEFDGTLFDETFIVFEIDSIKGHKLLFPLVTLIIMDVFQQKMYIKKNRKALIIEEAWL